MYVISHKLNIVQVTEDRRGKTFSFLRGSPSLVTSSNDYNVRGPGALWVVWLVDKGFPLELDPSRRVFLVSQGTNDFILYKALHSEHVLYRTLSRQAVRTDYC